MMIRNILLCLCLSQPAFAQVSSTAGTQKVITGIDGYEIRGSVILVPDDADPAIKTVGLLTVDCVASQISVRASEQDRTPVPVEDIGNNEFLVYGTGKVWIDVTCVDFDTHVFEQDFFTIEIGPAPDPDVPDPDPDPDDPDVAPDEFDNIGQRVAKWTSGNSDRALVAKAYAETAEILRSDPSATVDTSVVYLRGELQKIPSYATEYTEFAENVTADIGARWPFSRGVLADYYVAIVAGLGGVE